MNPFQILGIDKNATQDEIRRAYHRQAAKHHPDVGGDGWAFQQVREAYEQLSGESTKTSGQKEERDPPKQKPESGPTPPPFEDKTWATRRSGKRGRTKISFEAFKIVAGGLAGVVLGVLLLWFAFGVDPLGVMRRSSAPKVASTEPEKLDLEELDLEEVDIPEPVLPEPEPPELELADPELAEPMSPPKPEATPEPPPVDPIPEEPEDLRQGYATVNSTGAVELTKGSKVFSSDSDEHWSDVPPSLAGFRFFKADGSRILDFEVLKEGKVLMATTTRWAGGGGPGDWQKELVSRFQLESAGWREVGKLKSKGRNSYSWIVFERTCTAGEKFRYGTEKYVPPILIVGPGAEGGDPEPGKYKIVVWNTHNWKYGDVGTRAFDVTLYSRGKKVWKKTDVAIDWRRRGRPSVSIAVPHHIKKVDQLRLDITKCHGIAMGLAEIQVLLDGENVSLHRPVVASETTRRTKVEAITDGNNEDVGDGVGYWMGWAKTGWVEVNLASFNFRRTKAAKVVVDPKVGSFASLTVGAKISANREKYEFTYVPDSLSGLMYLKHNDIHQGVLKFSVRSSGTVLMAAQVPLQAYGEHGVTEKELLSEGWQWVETLQESWKVFARECKRGETMEYQTQKYVAPVLIVPRARK